MPTPLLPPSTLYCWNAPCLIAHAPVAVTSGILLIFSFLKVNKVDSCADDFLLSVSVCHWIIARCRTVSKCYVVWVALVRWCHISLCWDVHQNEWTQNSNKKKTRPRSIHTQTTREALPLRDSSRISCRKAPGAQEGLQHTIIFTSVCSNSFISSLIPCPSWSGSFELFYAFMYW